MLNWYGQSLIELASDTVTLPTPEMRDGGCFFDCDGWHLAEVARRDKGRLRVVQAAYADLE